MAGLLVAVALGFLLPSLGHEEGLLHLEWVTDFGVCGIFFLYGLTLDPMRMAVLEAAKRSLGRNRRACKGFGPLQLIENGEDLRMVD